MQQSSLTVKSSQNSSYVNGKLLIDDTGQPVKPRSGQQITVETEGASKAWSILLRGVEAAQLVDGGKAKKNPLGVLVTANKGASRLTIEL